MKAFRVAALGVGLVGVCLGVFVACSSSDDDKAASPKADAAVDVVTTAPTSTSNPVDSGSPIDSGAPDSNTPADSCAGYRYCEDFESYDGEIANAQAVGPWAASVSGVAMTVDGIRPHSGAKSLHITTTADGGAPSHGTLRQTPDGGLVPGNDVYGRAMVYYNDAPGFELPIGVHSWLFSTQGTSVQADGGVSLNMGGGGKEMQLNYHFIDGGEQSALGGNITTGAWHCIQWQLNGNKDGGKVANDDIVWLDGTEVVDAHVYEDAGGYHWPSAEPWKLFDFGFNHYQDLDGGANQPNFNVDVYLDDFAMNETMVPCP